MTGPGVVVSGSTAIPVRNLWLLMLYASRLYQTSELLRGRGVEDNPDDLFDLISEVLVTAVERRLQRTLGRQYRTASATLSRVRGRIDVLATESKVLLAQGRVACRFDELSVDNLCNRVLRTALVVAGRRVADPSLERHAASLVDVLTQYGVSPTAVGVRDARQLLPGRNQRDDVEAIDAARLLLEMEVPAEHHGLAVRRDPDRDVVLIRRLYEAAVRGFYRAVLPPQWTVSVGEMHQHWPVTEATDGLKALLPIMKVDMRLQTIGRRIIVETKFAEALEANRYGGQRLSRDYLFQLYAYVQSQHGRDDLSTTAEGVLLYPTVSEHVDESATIQGHRYRFLTVDLTANARDIRAALLSVPYSGQPAGATAIFTDTQ
ncbi:5-methylcytosine-specific restriction endonuclease system specificity protein McrC [Mycobacterium hodleri]|uniref:5-methylcytosine-specific restriction endonuclease system specificity protein McrC n=1 Tax=Mycolicibacterium hodleri TaxID=49897 RepID=A0A544VWR3_9MYCO|nr:5-methylcytosine-specific restriction endonuclease system specificity protein McrC [Mycolicibacterium hodleri]TQR84410.1 5-methylcytosine-specific restriction endonuclease system specificity protein McrC [Mycolicibacterium hodleri]